MIQGLLSPSRKEREAGFNHFYPQRSKEAEQSMNL